MLHTKGYKAPKVESSDEEKCTDKQILRKIMISELETIN